MKLTFEKINNLIVYNNKKYNTINIILEDINDNDSLKINNLGLYQFIKLISNGLNILSYHLDNININDLEIIIYDKKNYIYKEYFIIPKNKLINNFDFEFDKINNYFNYFLNNNIKFKSIIININISFPKNIIFIFNEFNFIKYFFNSFFNYFFFELNILDYENCIDDLLNLFDDICDNIKNSYFNNNSLSKPIKINKNITYLFEEDNINCSFSY